MDATTEEEEDEDMEDGEPVKQTRSVLLSHHLNYNRLNSRKFVNPREISTICRFNPRGDLIYVGTSKGNINIWDVQTKAVSTCPSRCLS